MELGQLFSDGFEALARYRRFPLPVPQLLAEGSIHHLGDLLVQLRQMFLVILAGVVKVPHQTARLFLRDGGGQLYQMGLDGVDDEGGEGEAKVEEKEESSQTHQDEE